MNLNELNRMRLLAGLPPLETKTKLNEGVNADSEGGFVGPGDYDLEFGYKVDAENPGEDTVEIETEEEFNLWFDDDGYRDQGYTGWGDIPDGDDDDFDPDPPEGYSSLKSLNKPEDFIWELPEGLEDAVEYEDMPERLVARAARMAVYTTWKRDGEGGVILSGDIDLGLNVYREGENIVVFVHHGYYPDEDETVPVIKSIFDAAKEYWKMPGASGELSAQKDQSAGGWAKVAREAGMAYSEG